MAIAPEELTASTQPAPLVKGSLRPIQPAAAPLLFQFNPAQVQVNGGTGGWGRRARPKRPVALEWEGEPEESVTFTLIFDGTTGETVRSVERDCLRLERMGRKRGHLKPPPILELEYGNVGRGRQWVIDSLGWGTEDRNRQLQRIYQEVTVTLLRYEEADVTLTPTQRHRDRQGGTDGSSTSADGNRVYRVKAGDTLSSIAAAKLGKASRWPEIAKLNGLRDPNKLTVGQRLRLPEA